MKTEENETSGDDFVEAAVEGQHAVGESGSTRETAGQMDERVLISLRAANEKKAVAPVVLDLRPIASFTDFFVVISGTNARQVQAITDAVVEGMRRAGARGVRTEGYNTAEWVLLDYGDFVVHIFEARARAFFDLERLWREAPSIPVTPEMLGETGTPQAPSDATETTPVEEVGS